MEDKKKALEVFNNKISFLSTLKEIMVNSFNEDYQINKELKVISNFLFYYFLLSRNRIISMICSLFDKYEIKNRKHTNYQLSFEYFIDNKETELFKSYNHLKKSSELKRITTYRHKYLSHYDLEHNLNEEYHLKEIGLKNTYIYDFVDKVIELAEAVNYHYGNYGLDLQIIEYSSGNLKILAERYNLAIDNNIIGIKILRDDDLRLYDEFQKDLYSLFEKYHIPYTF